MPQALSSQSASSRFWDATHNRAVRNVATLRDQVLLGFSLTSAEWFVLDVANRAAEPGISVGEVAQAMDVQTTYVALILRHLQAKKLVKTVPSSRDRRVHYVQLTAEGSKRLQASTAALEQEFAALTSPIAAADLEAYNRVIASLALPPATD